MNENLKNVDPQDYFNYVKSKKQQMTPEFLNNFETVIENELNKAITTGQNFMVKRLAFTLSSIEKENLLLKNEIDVYVLKDDIEEFIKEVADKAVKIMELEFYPRTIPDEIVEKVKKLKELDIFDRYYVVFTDYTDEVTKNVENERKRKDPILFGTFEKKIDGIWDIHDRFYFIGDWEDEYCDLTLTKMVEKMSALGKNIIRPLEPPRTKEEIQGYLNRLEEIEQDRFTLRPSKKKNFFEKVRTAWKEITS